MPSMAVERCRRLWSSKGLGLDIKLCEGCALRVGHSATTCGDTFDLYVLLQAVVEEASTTHSPFRRPVVAAESVTTEPFELQVDQPDKNLEDDRPVTIETAAQRSRPQSSRKSQRTYAMPTVTRATLSVPVVRRQSRPQMVSREIAKNAVTGMWEGVAKEWPKYSSNTLELMSRLREVTMSPCEVKSSPPAAGKAAHSVQEMECRSEGAATHPNPRRVGYYVYDDEV